MTAIKIKSSGLAKTFVHCGMHLLRYKINIADNGRLQYGYVAFDNVTPEKVLITDYPFVENIEYDPNILFVLTQREEKRFSTDRSMDPGVLFNATRALGVTENKGVYVLALVDASVESDTVSVVLRYETAPI